MNNKENMNICGTVILKLYDSNHILKNNITIKNMIVNGGLNFFIKKAADLESASIAKIKVSDGWQDVQLTDSDLHHYDTAAEQNIRFKSNTDTGEILLEAVFRDDQYLSEAHLGANTVAEVGLFDSKDIMLARTVLPESQRFVKTNSDFLSVMWKIKLG